jgi:hypothetical protein
MGYNLLSDEIRTKQIHCLWRHTQSVSLVHKEKKGGILYSAYPALSGGSRRWQRSMLPGKHGRQANSMSAHVLPPLAVNSKSKRKVNSLSPLGFEPVTFGMLVHLSDHSAKSHLRIQDILYHIGYQLTCRGNTQSNVARVLINILHIDLHTHWVAHKFF